MEVLKKQLSDKDAECKEGKTVVRRSSILYFERVNVSYFKWKSYTFMS